MKIKELDGKYVFDNGLLTNQEEFLDVMGDF